MGFYFFLDYFSLEIFVIVSDFAIYEEFRDALVCLSQFQIVVDC